MQKQPRFRRWGWQAASFSLLTISLLGLGEVLGPRLAAGVTAAHLAQLPPESALPEPWQPASPADQAQIWRF
ncbi:MAG TPA: hypothetical protein VLS96_14025, partial [Nodosilinea sp.]|nr:hypothetical protein [Nodosilinea sp.]